MVGKAKFRVGNRIGELDTELVVLTKNWKTGKRRSLQKIADMLCESGYCNSKGNPYGTGEISRMLKQ